MRTADGTTARPARIHLMLLVCILAVYGLSVYQKEATYADWQENPERYVVGPVTAMTTMDAYHWLKMARDLDAGHLGRGLSNPTKGYPDQVEYHDANLLARLISLGTGVTGGDYYRSALLLVSILGGLFVFPLFAFFQRLGFGAAAVMGGLVGQFSAAYYQRSAMGSLDTDLLNLFFPLLIACCIAPLDKNRSDRRNLFLAAAAGICMYLFNWWYEQPGMFLVYLFFILVYLVFARWPWRRLAAVVTVFTLASGPLYVLQSVHSIEVFWRAYFSPAATGGIVWPDVMLLIIEAQQPGMMGALKSIHGSLFLVCAGLLGLGYLYLRHFRAMLLVTPMVLLGLWSLSGPIRFAMYLAPLVGVGVGVLMVLLLRHAVPVLKGRETAVSTVAVGLMAALFFWTSGQSAFNWQPRPSLPAETTRALLEIKELVPPQSAMLSWWDMGYPLMEIGNFATFHDGSLHGGLRSTLIGKALAAARQQEMVALLAYLEDHGFASLQERIEAGELTAEELLQQVFSYPAPFRGENVHILYTDDMIRKFGSITESGMWNFATQSSDWVFYERWNCSGRIGNRYQCREGYADLDRGVIGDGTIDVPLNAVLFVDNGEVVSRRDYRDDARYYLQVLLKNQQLLQVQVVDRRLFETNFNQQFVLGNYDRRLFEEIYNNFPVARVFRVRQP